MGSALTIDRLQFAFTVTFHYIFPQITMGLALLILILKTRALRTGDERYNRESLYLFRDTVLKLIASPNLEYEDLTGRGQTAA